jgi:hypothetical protein
MNSAGESTKSRKNRMRSRPATGTASFVNSCSRCLSPRSGAMTASTGNAPKSAAWSKPTAKPQAYTHESTIVAGRQRPFLLRRAGGGLRPQRPGCQSREARFWKFFPAAILFRKLPAATGSAAIIQQNQERSRFAATTVIQFGSTGNRKFQRVCAEPVDVATSLWKAEEN